MSTSCWVSLLCVYRLWKFVWLVPIFKETGNGCVVVWCRVRIVVGICGFTSMFVSFLCRLSVQSALLNVNNMFSIHFSAALPSLHTNTRIVQASSCNATIALNCTDLHAKTRLRSDTHLSIYTQFWTINSSSTADNRTHVDIALTTANGLRNNFPLGISSWNILYVAGLQPVWKRREFSSRAGGSYSSSSPRSSERLRVSSILSPFGRQKWWDDVIDDLPLPVARVEGIHGSLRQLFLYQFYTEASTS
jgi:hypothetical protein